MANLTCLVSFSKAEIKSVGKMLCQRKGRRATRKETSFSKDVFLFVLFPGEKVQTVGRSAEAATKFRSSELTQKSLLGRKMMTGPGRCGYSSVLSGHTFLRVPRLDRARKAKSA